jgi:hypothetical protein
MGDWVDILQSFVAAAADQAVIRAKVIQAFDGEGWIWSWRERLPATGPLPARFREATVAARTDATQEGVSCQVQGRAWLEADRQAVWSQTYFADHQPVTDIEKQGHRHSLSKQIEDALGRAWIDAGQQAKRLSELKQRQQKSIDAALEKLLQLPKQ